MKMSYFLVQASRKHFLISVEDIIFLNFFFKAQLMLDDGLL